MPLHTDYSKSISNPKDSFEITRIPEVLILRKDLATKTIKEKVDFFNSIYVDSIEQLKKLLFTEYYINRTGLSRKDYDFANGYLFGFPDYAVEFFANSFSDKLADRNFKRSFIRIPVHGNGTTYSYAIPFGSPREGDKILKEKAGIILVRFKEERNNYFINDKFNAIQFIQDWYNNEI